MAELFCEKCHKFLKEGNFYTYKDGTKTELCKPCLTMHIDNFDPDTFLWLLEKMDVPYIPEEWNTLRDRAYMKNPAKMNGMSVFGKYLSKMKLIQWKKYGWADTERLMAEYKEKERKQEEERKKREEEIEQGYLDGTVSEVEYKAWNEAEEQRKEMIKILAAPIKPEEPISPTAPSLMPPVQMANTLNAITQPNNLYNEDLFLPEEDLIDPAAELTKEDKLYLAMKWGRLYKPGEWVELEKNYTQMMKSFDIQDADTENTLILLCKTNLKMNQCIDAGDVDGFQKLSRVSDSLRKSAKFTAAQNKEQKENFVDSVGELVSLCEREGFIPRFCTDIPQDTVDRTLKDMNNYLYKLVTQDLGFGQQIEDALKKIQIQKEMNEQDTDDPIELKDKDFEEFYSQVEKQKEADTIEFREEKIDYGIE